MSTTVEITWNHKDIWTCRGVGFTVEISRHADNPDYERGWHRWCVYGYVYPEHPLFAGFDGTEHFFQPVTVDLPMHGCIGTVSMIRYHRGNDGAITAIQFGSDYNHLHDERFTHMATREHANEVFRDAERLFEWLAELTPDVHAA